MHTIRSQFTATLLRNGNVIVVGGSPATTSAEIYDPAAGAFAPTGALITARYSHSAVLLANGILMICGGGQSSTVYLMPTEIYKPNR